MMIIEERYECGRCYTTHSSYDSAWECCPPQITTCYACPICDDVHTEKQEAIDCCHDQWEGDKEARPSAEELEAAGQTRLFT